LNAESTTSNFPERTKCASSVAVVPRTGEADQAVAFQIVDHVEHRADDVLRTRPPRVLAGAVRFVDEQDINYLAAEPAQALDDRFPQLRSVARFERLRSPTDLRRDDQRRANLAQDAADHVLAVGIRGGRIQVVDPTLDGANDGRSAVLDAGPEARQEQPAESHFAHRDSRAAQDASAHASGS
jgi:hypothetical protein